MKIDKIEKILIIQTAFLGDIVLTIPLINNLKKMFPDKYVAVLTTPTGKAVLEEQENIDEILLYDKKGKHKGFRNIFKLIEILNCMSFDWVISPHRSLRSAIIGYLAKIPHRWGFSNSEGRWFFTNLIDYKQELYDLERNFYFLEDFCDDPLKLDTKIEFPFNNAVEKITEDILAQKGWKNEKIIGVHTGSKWFTKKWPTYKFQELLKILAEKGYKIIVFGDKDDIEIDNFLKFEFDSSDILNLIDKTDIKQLISYFRKLAVYVTNDSGPMHIAAAMDIPIVAIFGPTVKELGFFPYTNNSTILEVALNCRPCGKHGGRKCKEKHFKCMEDILVEEVIKAVEEFV